jgi:hypothetical protein
MGSAQPHNELIQRHEKGGINWTQGKIFAVGEWVPEDHQFGKPVDPLQAMGAAKANLFKIIETISINSHTQTAHYFNQRGSIFQEIRSMVDHAAVTTREYFSDGSMKVGLEMPLWGSFTQLLLPSEIRQVDVIKPIHPNLNVNAANQKQATATTNAHSALRSKEFTGLVLDARGIEVQPAMVPLIRDESGQEMYGPAWVSREFAVQHGMCIYVREMTGIRIHPRVRYNPIIIKCLRAEGEKVTDLTIDDKDAARLRGAPEHVAFLREGRVIIVVD